MEEYKPNAGKHIVGACKDLIELVKANNGNDVCMHFNGIVIVANKTSTVENLCKDYDRLCEIRSAEYRASPEGIEQARQRKDEQEALQKQADELMEALPRLNFNDVENLLDWLCAIEAPRDRVGVNVDAQEIRKVFIEHGYLPDANCGDDFNETDLDNYARWIIGQALNIPCPPMIRHFTEQWKKCLVHQTEKGG